jgi:hypothetical protein
MFFFRSKYETDSLIILNTTAHTKFLEIKSTAPYSYYKPRKNYDFQQFYRISIENSYNEVDIFGFVIYICNNPYQDIVYLASLNQSNAIICVLFPKNSDVN